MRNPKKAGSFGVQVGFRRDSEGRMCYDRQGLELWGLF